MINSRNIQMRRTALAVAAAMSAFGMAHVASADAAVNVEKTALGNYFVGAGGEDNDIHISGAGGKILVQDSKANVVAGANCQQVTPNAVECPDLPEGGVYASTGGGTDRVDSTASEYLYVNGSQTSKLTVFGGYGDNTIIGGDGNDVLNGGLGSDTVQGGKGNDVLSGNIGSDTLEGGEGNDSFKADAGADDYKGGAGTDRVDYTGRVAALDITLNNVANDGQSGEGDNVRSDVENVTGGKGADDISGTDGANVLIGGDGDDDLTGFGGQDKLYGEADQDKLYAGAGDDLVYGGEGMDRLEGGPGADVLNGMNGPDTLLGGTENDKLLGGAGTDTVSYQSLTDPVTVDLDGSAFDDGPANEGDTVGADVEDIIGGKGDDTLTGNGAANYIQGGLGRDTIDGMGGEDTLMGQDGDDTLNALDGLADTANCGLGNDKVSADGIDILVGCEDTGAKPADPTTTPDPTTNPTPKAGVVVIGIATKASVKKGKAKVKLACPASAKSKCAGTLVLRTTKKKAIGSAKFSIAPGKKAQVTVKLGGTAVKALRKSRKLTAVARAGTSSTGKVTLRLAR